MLRRGYPPEAEGLRPGYRDGGEMWEGEAAGCSGRRSGDLQRIGPVWYEMAGYEHLEPVRWPEQAARYCAKYLVKDEGAELVFSDNFGRERQGVLASRFGPRGVAPY